MNIPEVIIENEKDGTVMVLIPAGNFLASEDKFPVDLPAYYMAIHPVTNAQYAHFLNGRKPNSEELEKWIELNSDCFVRQSDTGYEAYGGKESHPVVQVSWYGAKAYCEWAGLRLPTELEWEKGSRGIDGREYPWGNEWENGRMCRNYNSQVNKTIEEHIALMKGNMTPLQYVKWCMSQTTVEDYAYPGGVSPYGLYQMSGNVMEWCEDWYDSDSYKRYKSGTPTLPASGTNRCVRGSSWHHSDSGFFSCTARSKCSPGSRYDIGGFRCVRTG